MIKLNYYKIPRHISRPKRTGFFCVNVPEVKEYGFGFQVSTNKHDYGLSIHSLKKSNDI